MTVKSHSAVSPLAHIKAGQSQACAAAAKARYALIANWKRHGRRADIERWAAEIKVPAAMTNPSAATKKPGKPAHTKAGRSQACAAAVRADYPPVVICPPMCYLGDARRCLPLGVALGAQSVAADSRDFAQTGSVSAAMLADVGCEYVIVGHSEQRLESAVARRGLGGGGESGDDISYAKMAAAVSAAGMRPILCVGESRRERDAGQSAEAARRQMAFLATSGRNKAARAALWANLIIAYEPWWAIGRGKTPSERDIVTMLHFIRGIVSDLAGGHVIIPVLYGGSVSPDNIGELAMLDGVDGFLVGGASLDAAKMNLMMEILATL